VSRGGSSRRGAGSGRGGAGMAGKVDAGIPARLYLMRRTKSPPPGSRRSGGTSLKPETSLISLKHASQDRSGGTRPAHSPRPALLGAGRVRCGVRCWLPTTSTAPRSACAPWPCSSPRRARPMSSARARRSSNWPSRDSCGRAASSRRGSSPARARRDAASFSQGGLRLKSRRFSPGSSSTRSSELVLNRSGMNCSVSAMEPSASCPGSGRTVRPVGRAAEMATT